MFIAIEFCRFVLGFWHFMKCAVIEFVTNVMVEQFKIVSFALSLI